MTNAGAPNGGAARTSLLSPVFIRIMLVNFGYFLSIGISNPILPRFVEEELNSSDIGVGIAVGAFTITSLLLRPFSGRFGDQRGRHLPIIAGCVVHTVATGGFLLADSLLVVVILRMVTGISEALIFVGVASAVQDISPDDRRGEAASLFSLSLFLALAIGPLIGEGILSRSDYTAVWIAATIAIVFGLLVSFTLRDTRTHTDPNTEPGPLIHPAALHPGFILGCAIWGLAAFNTFITLYVLEIGLDGAGLVFLLNSVTILAFRLFGARLPDRLGPITAGRFALTCTPIGLALMAVWGTPMGVYVGAVILGAGQAMAFPALMTVAINNAPGSERGSVMGTFTGFFDLMFGGGAFMLGFVAHSLGYSATFGVAAAVATLGTLQIFFLPPKQKGVPLAPCPPVIEIHPPGE